MSLVTALSRYLLGGLYRQGAHNNRQPRNRRAHTMAIRRPLAICVVVESVHKNRLEVVCA